MTIKNENNIICPNCSFEINVSDILYKQIQGDLKKEFENLIKQKDEDVKKKLLSIDKEKEDLLKEKENIKSKIEKEVNEKINSAKIKYETELKNKIEEENKEQILMLEKEIHEKTNQVKELNKTKIEIEKLKREKEELFDTISLEKEKEFSNKLKDEKIKIQKQIEDSSILKIRELEKQLDDQKKLAEEMKRKAEQGSMQMQGEVQELILEEYLRAEFPFDVISEVGKGVKGADVVHSVRNKIGSLCGTILYESKRTKAFSNDWINKLKADAVSQKADICIIVTETLPDGIERIGQKDNVWICSFNDLKGLVLVLRESLIKINEAFSSQTNKGEKMQMLYDYLTSNEFTLQLSSIIEGFNDLQSSYQQEKRAMERIWKQREKQLEKVLLNTNHFIGAIKGIAGSSMPNLKQIGKSDNIFELED